MARSEMCVDDSIREDNMNNVANDESCHLLAIGGQVKETISFLTPPLVIRTRKADQTWSRTIFKSYALLI